MTYSIDPVEQSLLDELCLHPNELSLKHEYANLLLSKGKEDIANKVRKKFWTYSGLDSLIGKVVEEVYLDRSRDQVILVTDEAPICLYVEGDCCSVSWWYAITNLQALLGERVIMILDGDYWEQVDPDDGLCLQESDRVYSVGLLTKKGITEFTYRNSSNGYYGGWMEIATMSEFTPTTPPLTEDWIHPPVEKKQ